MSSRSSGVSIDVEPAAMVLSVSISAAGAAPRASGHRHGSIRWQRPVIFLYALAYGEDVNQRRRAHGMTMRFPMALAVGAIAAFPSRRGALQVAVRPLILHQDRYVFESSPALLAVDPSSCL